MPDARPTHTTVSLLNTPTPPFTGAANSLSGPRGPPRAHTTGRHAPQSLADHVDLALDRVKGLGPKQKLALHNELLRMLRDIEVIKLIHDSTRGPHSDSAAGRPMLEGQPL